MKDHASPKARRRLVNLSWTGIGGRRKDQVRPDEKARQGACALNHLLKTARSRAERDVRVSGNSYGAAEFLTQTSARPDWKRSLTTRY
ncbi:hypothetical protein [Burkholderia ubonensis]|uniref:hypothetical protein n=1 Tax=Burkholderia ubonensis TaxID=101571 RepID=UPI0015842068|nr:hypothetical protein [Burkholderia ubonensis]